MTDTAGPPSKLTAAPELPGLREPWPKLVALIPAGGWRWSWHEGGRQRSEPLVGWGLDAEGMIFPLATDGTGLVLRLDPESIGDGYRIYHPVGELGRVSQRQHELRQRQYVPAGRIATVLRH